MVVLFEYFLLLLLTKVLSYAEAQIICRIEIDSAKRLWIDSTPALLATNNASFCAGYLFREISLKCTAKTCPSSEHANDKCKQYYNAEKWAPIVYSCTGCYRITQTEPRYSRTAMCVPIDSLNKCASKQFNEKGECFPKFCTENCANGHCDEVGSCTCWDGYKKDRKANLCLLKECVDSCDNGHCTEYDKCICKNGFKNDQRNKYKCIQINCPDREHISYCQRECVYDRCGENNGFCDKGECICKKGFTKNLYNVCEIIDCDSDDMNVCQSKCLNSTCTQANGRCVEGECKCSDGYKKLFNNKYWCEKINCPERSATNFCQRECQNSKCTQNNGLCELGKCICKDGYKKDLNDREKCVKISCPSTDNERFRRLQCLRNCDPATCINKDTCSCKVGLKKYIYTTYKCNKSNCPSDEDDENSCCESQCKNLCENGNCDSKGFCKCVNVFEKLSSDINNCVNNICRSTSHDVLSFFCKEKCKSLCKNGVCDDMGACICKTGFRKIATNNFTCSQINCATSSVEDTSYCVSLCNVSCTNGKCNGRGVCECDEGFVATSNVSVDCHHTCNLDDSCNWTIIVGISGGGLLVIVVVLIIAVAAFMIRTKIRKEQFIKDNGRFNLAEWESTDRRPTTECTARNPTNNSRDVASYLEPRRLEQDHSRNSPQPHAAVGRDVVKLSAPQDHGSNRTILEFLSEENDTETPISAVESSPVYDTPYDHVDLSSRVLGPRSHNTTQTPFHVCQSHSAIHLPKPPNVLQIREQQKRLKSVPLPRALCP